MSAVLKPKKLTVAEYLALEKAAEFKSEFYDGEMFAMAGASRDHNRVKENLIVALGNAFKGGPCQTFSSDQRVRVHPNGLYTYPDIVIVCGPEEFAPEDEDTLTNPTAVVEVLSDSTQWYDRTAKYRQYQRIATFREYLLVAQDDAVCERFTRQPDGQWTHLIFTGLDAELVLTAPPVRIPLAEIYRNVELPPPTLRQPYGSRP